MNNKHILVSSDFIENLPNNSLENILNPKIYIDNIIIKNKTSAIISIIPIETDKYYINKLLKGNNILLKKNDVMMYFEILDVYYKNLQLKIKIKYKHIDDILYFNNNESYIIFNYINENSNT